MKYCNDKEILSVYQSAFLEKYNCETATQFVINDLRLAVRSDQLVEAGFLNFRRDFETIDRARLVTKLRCYGINGTALK